MISRYLSRIAVPLAVASFVLAACGGAAIAPDPTTSPTAAASTTTPAPSPSATAATTTLAIGTWTVSNTSKATVRVREQLVGVNLPSDAVLVATGATGSFVLNDDGTFSSDSKITFDLTTLASDQRDRDNFVKMDTLQTRQFPTATFVPTKTTGLTLPLPTSGDFTFKLAGQITIHGKTKDVTFDVTAKRSGNELTATTTASPTWKFADFGMTAPSVPFRVVSVVDEIRLVVDLVATATA
ncbi:MAG TPA: YceI family protein [Candidatus Limnocylindria bacterium]|jgi:polyisoprenoid-binding protein YceI|nr:YceI family protein [Candidatus Limnocylindria bacterium]